MPRVIEHKGWQLAWLWVFAFAFSAIGATEQPIFDQRDDDVYPEPNAFWGSGDTDGRRVAQEFVPELNGLDFVELYLVRLFPTSSRGDAFELAIREDTVNGRVVGGGVASLGPQTGPSVVRFRFFSRVPLTPGRRYVMELMPRFSAFQVSLGIARGDVYPGGQMLFGGEPTGWDLWFREGIIVPAPAVIERQPFDQTVYAGKGACFFAGASGATPLSYQWRVDGLDIPYQTNTSLCLSSVDIGQAGEYSVVASNAVNVVTSQVAKLTVLPGPPPSNSHPALVASWPWTIEDFGYVNVVAAKGSYAYGLARGGGFLIFDLKDPSIFHPVGAVNLPGNPMAIAVAGSHAFVAAGVEGLLVVDISDPTLPRVVGQWRNDGAATSVAMKGTVAFVTDYSAGLTLIDISDPARPRELSQYMTGGSSSVSVSGNFAYVASGNGITVLNVSDTRAPRLVKVYAFSSGVRSVIAADGRAYAATGRGFTILDVTHPRQPRKVGKFDSGRGAADTMALKGRYVIIADDDGIMQVVDVLNPARPARVGVYLDLPEEAYNVAASGPYVYLADTGGLHLLDLRKLAVSRRASSDPSPIPGIPPLRLRY